MITGSSREIGPIARDGEVLTKGALSPSRDVLRDLDYATTFEGGDVRKRFAAVVEDMKDVDALRDIAQRVETPLVTTSNVLRRHSAAFFERANADTINVDVRRL